VTERACCIPAASRRFHQRTRRAGWEAGRLGNGLATLGSNQAMRPNFSRIAALQDPSRIAQVRVNFCETPSRVP